MGRHRNVRNPRTVTVIVDGDIYDKFIEQLPNKTGTSEAIRNLISAQVEETEKIKNLSAPDYGAIRTQESNNIYLNKYKNLTLDIFQSKTDINVQLDSIKELEDMRKLRDRGKMVYAVMDTRIKKLVLTK